MISNVTYFKQRISQANQINNINCRKSRLILLMKTINSDVTHNVQQMKNFNIVASTSKSCL